MFMADLINDVDVRDLKMSATPHPLHAAFAPAQVVRVTNNNQRVNIAIVVGHPPPRCLLFLVVWPIRAPPCDRCVFLEDFV